MSVTVYTPRGPVTIDAVVSEPDLRLLSDYLIGLAAELKVDDFSIDLYPERLSFEQVRDRIRAEVEL